MDNNIFSTKQYLVFSSIGDNSIHDKWIDTFDENNRLFDIVLVYYGSDDEYYERLTKIASDDIIILRRKGFKWPNFNWFISNNDVSNYNYIWVPDDDLQISKDGINNLFKTVEKYPNIMIAAPSTSHDSVTSGGGCRYYDKHNCNLLIEYNDFVETGLILIKKDMMENEFFRKILSVTNTGYYFDLLIKFCFNDIERNNSIAIIHNTVVKHPKRIGASEMDKVLPRNLHPSDIGRFKNVGIQNHMLQYGIKKISTIPKEGKCMACKLS